MNDALCIAVTGFQTQVAGNKLIKVLNEIGLNVVFCADGESDSMGGIIETAIAPVVTLETDEPGTIVEALQSALPDVPFSVLYTSYNVAHDDEFHVEPTDSGVSDRKTTAPELRVVADAE